jgi:hypothetical protein
MGGRKFNAWNLEDFKRIGNKNFTLEYKIPITHMVTLG